MKNNKLPTLEQLKMNESLNISKNDANSYKIDADDGTYYISKDGLKILRQNMADYIKTGENYEGELDDDLYVYINEDGVEILSEDAGDSILIEFEELKDKLINLSENLDSVNKEDCLVGDATGYLIPSDDVLSKLTKDEILKMMNKMSDKQYDAQVANKELELDELVSATKYLEKYLEMNHGMKVHEILEGRSKVNMDEDASDVYDKFGKKFPNASDLIAYYIFDYKESDNGLLKHIDKDGSDLSSLAMEYENSWEDNMEDIDNRVKELLNINETKTINKDVLFIVNMLNFTSDWDNKNEFDYKIDGNQFEAISKEIAADISKDLTANNIEHELNDVYITLTGFTNESIKESYSVEKDGSDGYLFGDGESGEEFHITTEEIKKLLGFMDKYEKTNKDFNGKLNKTLEIELDSEGLLIRDTDYDVSLLFDTNELKNLIMAKVQGINESYSISAGKGEITSKEQAMALIPNQKEVDGEQVDFQEGESITVSDGENSYKFVWIGGSPKEAPEEEQTNENRKKYKRLPLLGEKRKTHKVNEELNPLDLKVVYIKSLMYDYVILGDSTIFDLVGNEEVPDETQEAAWSGEQEIAVEVAGSGGDTSVYLDVLNDKMFINDKYIDERKLQQITSKIR